MRTILKYLESIHNDYVYLCTTCFFVTIATLVSVYFGERQATDIQSNSLPLYQVFASATGSLLGILAGSIVSCTVGAIILADLIVSHLIWSINTERMVENIPRDQSESQHLLRTTLPFIDEENQIDSKFRTNQPTNSYIGCKKAHQNEKIDKCFISFNLLLPLSIIIAYAIKSPSIVMIFATVVAMQFTSSTICVIRLLNRYSPEVFTESTFFGISLSLHSMIAITFVGFYSPISHWHSLIATGLIITIYLILVYKLYILHSLSGIFNWRSQDRRASKVQSTANIETLATNEMPTDEVDIALLNTKLYLGSYIWSLIAVTTATASSSWASLSSWQANLLMYSMIPFGLAMVLVPSLVASILRYERWKVDVQLNQEIIKSRKDIVRLIAHELRTPIMILMSKLDFMEQDIKLSSSTHLLQPPVIANDLTTAVQGCKDVVRVLDNIVAFENLGRQNHSLKIAFVPAWNLVNSVVTSWSNGSIEDNGINLVYERVAPAESFRNIGCFWNPDEIKRVIRDLVRFIASLSSDSKPTVTVSIDIVNNSPSVGGTIPQIADESPGCFLMSHSCMSHAALDRVTPQPPTRMFFSSELGEFIIDDSETLEIKISTENNDVSQRQYIAGLNKQMKSLDVKDLRGGGLSLVICNMLVVAHKGSLQVTTESCSLNEDNNANENSNFDDEELVSPSRVLAVSKFPLIRRISVVDSSSNSSKALGVLSIHQKQPSSSLSRSSSSSSSSKIFINPPVVDILCASENRVRTDSDVFNGTIMINNDDNHSISLEPRETSQGQLQEQLRKKQSKGQSLLTRPVAVLLADDSALCRKVMDELLRRYAPPGVKFFTVHADDGVSVLKEVEKLKSRCRNPTSFDVLFLDNVMKTMHGPETASRLRSQGFTGPIIGVTGNVLSEDIAVFEQAGADMVFGKPVDKVKLTKFLRTLIDGIASRESTAVGLAE